MNQDLHKMEAKYTGNWQVSRMKKRTNHGIDRREMKFHPVTPRLNLTATSDITIKPIQAESHKTLKGTVSVFCNAQTKKSKKPILQWELYFNKEANTYSLITWIRNERHDLIVNADTLKR